MKTYLRGNVWYVRLDDGTRPSLGVRKGVEGEAALVQAALAKLLSGDSPRAARPSGPTLETLYTKALASHWANVKDRRGVESRWLDVRAFFGASAPVASLSASLIADFKTWLQGGTVAGHDTRKTKDNPKTVNRKLALLSKMLHLAAEWDMIDKLPIIKREKESQGRLRWLSRPEEATATATLRAWTERPHADTMAELTEFLVDTGLRLGEALRVQDKDFDLAASPRPRVTVWESKGGRPRTVPLTARAAAIIGRRLRREKDRDEERKGSSRPFGGLTQDICGHLWSDVRAAMGLAHDGQFVIHALRHTFAVRMVEAGVDVTVIRDLMGHAKIETTMVYAHVSGSAAADAIGRLDRVRDAVPEVPVSLAAAGSR